MFSKGNCFTLTSSVQQDLSEFLLPGQQDLLPVNTSNTTEYENVTFNIPLNPTEPSEPTESNNTTEQQIQPVLQDLSLQNIENLENLLSNTYRGGTSENTQQQQSEEEMHSSLPSVIRHSGHSMDYNVQTGCYTNGKNAHPEAFAMRKIKVSFASYKKIS